MPRKLTPYSTHLVGKNYGPRIYCKLETLASSNLARSKPCYP